MSDAKLWKVFSVYIRLRDADENGYCICITSGRRVHWTECDAGHFISSRHLNTKYNEKNVNAQSRHDNRFQYGRQYEYSLAIDKKYGQGTAENLLAQSRVICKRDRFEIDILTAYYKEQVKILKLTKGL